MCRETFRLGDQRADQHVRAEVDLTSEDWIHEKDRRPR